MRRPGPRKWEFSLDFCPGAVTKVKPSPVGRQKESQAKGPISQFCGDEDMLGANIICQAAPCAPDAVVWSVSGGSQQQRH